MNDQVIKLLIMVGNWGYTLLGSGSGSKLPLSPSSLQVYPGPVPARHRMQGCRDARMEGEGDQAQSSRSPPAHRESEEGTSMWGLYRGPCGCCEDHTEPTAQLADAQAPVL